jgi:hypothetical protein
MEGDEEKDELLATSWAVRFEDHNKPRCGRWPERKPKDSLREYQ